MRKKLFNIILLFISFCLMLSVSFGWWIEGIVFDSFVIKSAIIDSKITIYQGNDFNHDGILDKINPYDELTTTKKPKEHVLALTFTDLLPTEVYTWKVEITNSGDASGFVYASIWDKVYDSKNGLTDTQLMMIKYMSIKLMGEDDKTKVYIGNALKDTQKTIVLFGGTDQDLVEVGDTKEYVFQIQLETFNNLFAAGVCEDTKEEFENYQYIQKLLTATGTFVDEEGNTVTYKESFKFLDISLSSTQPNTTTIPNNVNN